MADLSIYFTDTDFIFVEKRVGSPKLKDYGAAKIPEGLIQNGRIKDIKKLTKFVETVLSYSSVTARRTNLLLHEKIITYSTFQIPESVKQRNYSSYINKKVKEESATPFSDPIFDYDVAQVNGETRAVVISTSESIMNDYIQILSNVGLRVNKTDAPALASYKMYFFNKDVQYHETNLMFVNIYNKMISINIFSENVPVFNVIFDNTVDLKEDAFDNAIQTIQDEIYRMNNYYEWNINQGKVSITSAIILPFTSNIDLNEHICKSLKEDNQTGIENIRFLDPELDIPFDVHIKYMLTMANAL